MAPRGNSFDYTTNRHEKTVYSRPYSSILCRVGTPGRCVGGGYFDIFIHT